MKRDRVVPLGELFMERGERSSDSSADTAYVAMEHVDPGSSHIDRYGKASDATSIKSVFRSGDVLFGKLRPYLRKTVIAELDGVCSTELLVLTPRREVESGYLLALLQSEPVVQAVITASAGTRMPRVSIRDLASIKVPVLDLIEQRRIVDLLTSVDNALNQMTCVVRDLRSLRSNLLRERLAPKSASSEWRPTTLGDIADLTIGRTPSRSNPEFWTSDLSLPFCTIADMKSRLVEPQREGITAKAEAAGVAKRVPKGSLLMSFKLTIGRVGFAARDVFPNEAIVWIKSRDQAVVREDFLGYALEAADLSASGRAVKGETLNGPSLRAIRLVVPSIEEQAQIAGDLGLVDSALERAAAKVSTTRALRSALLADALSGGHRIPESYDHLMVASQRTELTKVA